MSGVTSLDLDADALDRLERYLSVHLSGFHGLESVERFAREVIDALR